MAGHRYTILTGQGHENRDEDGEGYENQETHPASSAEELWKATDAMQRAADTMIATTESFRQQIHEQDGADQQLSTPYQPHRPDDIFGFHPDSSDSQPPTTSKGSSSAMNIVSGPPSNTSPSLLSTLLSNESSRRSHTPHIRPPSSSRAQPKAPMVSQTETQETTAVATPVPTAATLNEFIPQRWSSRAVPPVNTNVGKHSGMGEGPTTGGEREMVDVELSPVTNGTSGTGGLSMTQWSGAGSTPTVVQNFTPARPSGFTHMSKTSIGHASRHVDLVTAAEHYRNSAMLHPNPLHSNPSANGVLNPNLAAPGITVQKTPSSPTSPHQNARGRNYSTTSFGSSAKNTGGLSSIPRDSVDDFNTPLFPRPTAGGSGHGLYGPLAPGGVKRNALSRSFKRAKAHIPQLSPATASAVLVDEKNPRTPPSLEQGPILSKAQEIMFVLVICLADGLMLAGLAQGIAPMLAILEDFPGAEQGETTWYTAAYALTAGAFVLPGGRLGDVFGPKRMFVLGFLWLAVWSLACGFGLAAERAGGNGNLFFVFCRAMQGVGPGVLLPNGQVLVGKVFPRRSQKHGLNLATVMFGTAAPAGFVAGSAMSALFAASASWPWSFFTMAAVCLATCGLALLALPSSRCDARASHEDDGLFALLDVPGMALLVAGLVLFGVGWNEAPTCGWQTPYVYFVVILGMLVLAGFVYVERHASFPLIPLARMRAEAAVVMFALLAGWMAWGVWVVYTFRFLIEQRDLEPLLASAQIADFAILGLLGSLLLAVLFDKGIKPPMLLVAGMLAFVAASILLATAPVDQVYWINVFIATIVLPLGMEFVTPAATAMLEMAMPEGEWEGASSLVMMTVNFGICLGLGVAGTVERYVGNEGEKELAGIKGGQWTGAGLAGLGFVSAVVLLMVDRRSRSTERVPSP
ncbi:MFS general substrate transporter [Zalerion maritima]|uniref:MFS general substrate transporter n=1 Tax=Zalerion maritima TaxID=339359 RepID=A0AAD5WQ71_9PEZI|nr:MFS general substrate transporter [Zalerion maritima]